MSKLLQRFLERLAKECGIIPEFSDDVLIRIYHPDGYKWEMDVLKDGKHRIKIASEECLTKLVKAEEIVLEGWRIGAGTPHVWIVMSGTEWAKTQASRKKWGDKSLPYLYPKKETLK